MNTRLLQLGRVIFLSALLTHTISAIGQCNADFTVSTPTSCAQQRITFTATNDPGHQSYLWDFGDNTESTNRVANHAYAATNNDYNVTVTLVVTDTSGMTCRSQQTLQIQATPRITGEVPLANQQLCLSANSPRDTFTTVVNLNPAPNNDYTWNWGDGTAPFNSNEASLSHQYTQYGSFPIEISFDNGTCTGYFRDTIRFFKRPSVDIKFELGNTTVCERELVKLLNETPSDVVEYYIWDWGDGSALVRTNNNETPQHSYDLSGTNKCITDQLDFDITVEAFNSCPTKNSHKSSVQVFVDAKLDPKIVIPDTVCVNEEITFGNETCPPPAQGISFEWDFGDGSPISTEIEPEHSYDTPGTYTISLKGINGLNNCGDSTARRTIVVTDKPIADVTFTGNGVPDQSSGCAPFRVVIDNQTLPNTGVNFEWDIVPREGAQFVDNTNENSRNPVIVFSEGGTYEVRMIAQNKCGTDEWTQMFDISSSPRISLTPVGDQCDSFSYIPDVTFTDGGVPIDGFNWTFQGGIPATSDQQTPPPVTFAPSEDPYVVEVSASNACGTFTTTDTFFVTDVPRMNMALVNEVDSGCVGLEVLFENNSTPPNGVSYTWVPSDGSINFINGTDPNTPEAAFAFTQVGTFTLAISGENVCGSADTTFAFQIADIPQIDLTEVSDTCGNFSLQPNAIIQENEGTIFRYNWQFPGGNPVSSDQATPPLVDYAPNDNPYQVSLEVENRCGVTRDSINFSVLGLANLRVPEDTTICANEGAIVRLATPPGGNWSGEGVSPEGIFSPPTPNDATYELTYELGTGACRVEATTQVQVLAAPEATVAWEDTAVCQASPALNLAGFPAGGIWNNQSVTDTLLSTATIQGYDLFYVYTDPNTQCKDTAYSQTEILGLPEINLPTSPVSYCRTDALLTLDGYSPLDGENGGRGRWKGIGIQDAAAGTFLQAAFPGDMGEFTYVFTNIAGCTDSSTLTVTIVDPEEPDAGTDMSICINEGPLILEGFSPPGGQWRVQGSPTLLDSEVDLLELGGGDHILTYTIGEDICARTNERLLTIFDTLEVDAGGVPDEGYCVSEPSFRLTGATPPGGIWEGLGIENREEGIFNASIVGAGNTTILMYEVVSQDNCTSKDIRPITVNGLPELGFNVADTACVQTEISFGNESTGGTRCLWEFGDGNSTEQCDPIHTYEQAGEYVIQLTIGTPDGCLDSLEKPITITDIPRPAFTLDPFEACAERLPDGRIGLTAQVIDMSEPAGGTYEWDPGNGEPPTAVLPPSWFYPQGPDTVRYTVTLTLQNQCETVSAQREVQVFPLPQVDIGLPRDEFCSPFVIQSEDFFNLTVGNPESYEWREGDNVISRDSVPQSSLTLITGDRDSTYFLTLLATNTCGTDEQTIPITVFPNTLDASISLDTTKGCMPLTIQPTDFSGATFSIWDFGDGSQRDTSRQVNHVYTEAGEYIIQLVSHNFCSFDTTYDTVEVFPAILSHAVLEGNCQGDSISFSPQVQQGIAAYIWDFGDGQGDTTNANGGFHVYEAPGTYEVQLTTLANTFFCPASWDTTYTIDPLPDLNLDPGPLTDCPDLDFRGNNTTVAQAYFWDFGDNNTSVAQSPTHTYSIPGTYEVALEVISTAGCEIDTSFTVTVFDQPEANFEVDTTSLCQGGTFTFTNLSTLDRTAFEWDMGNNDQFTTTDLTYTYPMAGTYSVSLTVTNNFGCQDQTMKSVEVFTQPRALFELNPGIRCEGESLTFLATDSQATDWEWDLGDGSPPRYQTQFSHTYPEPGSYPITLIVSANEMCRDTATEVYEVFPKPEASISYELDTYPTGLVQFRADSLPPDARVKWYFSCPTDSSELPAPRHTFNYLDIVGRDTMNCTQSGFTYIITLPGGCADTVSQSLSPPYGDLFIPTAFAPLAGAPAGDAQYFLPKGIGLEKFHVAIYTQWGNLLWESKDELDQLGQPTGFWDGTLKGAPVRYNQFIWKVLQVKFRDGRAWKGPETGILHFNPGKK